MTMEIQHHELGAITKRLDAVERQNRWFKGIGATALLIGGAVMLMGAGGGPQVVEANKFVLKDMQGKVIADLAPWPGGQFGVNPPAVLTMYSSHPQFPNAQTVQLIGGSEAGLTLANYKGQERILLTSSLSGQPVLRMEDNNNKNFFTQTPPPPP